MEMASISMSCKRPILVDQGWRVVVKFPKTPRERREECCNGCRECCNGVARPFVWSMKKIFEIVSKTCCIIFFVFIALVGAMYIWIIPILYCQLSPGLDLKDVNVHAMNVYQNNTLPGTPYQANSDMSLQLKAWNPNKITGCFSTFRRVAVSVDYKGQRLLHQVVPLQRFGLKPRESRNMTLDLRGENAPLTNEIGSLLASEARNMSTAHLEFTLSFAARYLRNDRTADWMLMNCFASTKAPPTSTGGLLYRLCTDG